MPVSTFEAFGDGWDCFTYLANDEWVFQFPRSPGASRTLRMQITLLPEVASEVSSAVPVPEFVSEDPLCIGYRRIEGVPISAAPEGIWPERLGRFIYDLHLMPPEYVGMRPRTPADVREEIAAAMERYRSHVAPLLDANELAGFEGVVAGYLDDDVNFRFSTCLTHGDIVGDHVLVGPAGDLAGVIDWGDASVGDPAWDFAWLLHAMPDEGDRALGAYGGPPDERFLARARFGFAMMPCSDVGYGMETDQPSFVDRGLAALRERLAGSGG